MDRRSGTRKVVDRVDFHVQRECHVVTHQLEARVAHQVRHVLPAARVEVIDAQHFVPLFEKPLAEVGAEEAGAAGY